MSMQVTIDKLIEMRLTTMADAFSIQADDPKMLDIPFADRVAMLVDAEYTSRKSNRLKRLINGAEFEQPDAHIADVNYTSGRKLNKELILRPASCEYITEYHNVFITGKTGTGKTYLACASALPLSLMRHAYRIVGRLAPSTGSISAGQAAQHAPDRRLKPHQTGGSAAPEYSINLTEIRFFS